MTAISSSPTRRSLLAGSAATGAVSLLPMHFVSARAQSKQEGSPLGTTKADAILPFRVNVRGEDLANLRRRLAATRWPAKELVEDRSQGVQLATLRALARYWSTGYDWRKCEARLNALPQFTTVIDGVKIHFIHVKSRATIMASQLRDKIPDWMKSLNQMETELRRAARHGLVLHRDEASEHLREARRH